MIREFGKNRGKNLAEVYKYLKQKENSLMRFQLDIDIPPILADEREFKKLVKLHEQNKKLVKEIKNEILALQKKVYDYNWNDPVSELYKSIFSSDIIVKVNKSEEELIADLEFRIHHSIAPGYKDSGKSDNGIGDLIIWQTIKEIGQKENNNIIYVTDDSKNDWFYVEEKKTVYPRYELLYEFKQETKKTIHLIDITEFLILFNSTEEAIKEVSSKKIEQNISDNESWTPIHLMELKVGMHITYSKSSEEKGNKNNTGIITNISNSNLYFKIVTLIKTESNTHTRVAGNRYSWWRRNNTVTNNV